MESGQERYFSLADAAGLAVFDCRLDTNELRWLNSHVASVLGCAHSQAPRDLGGLYALFVDPRERAAFEDAIGNCARTGRSLRTTVRLRRLDGIEASLKIAAVFDAGPDDACTSILASLQPLEEQSSTLALRESESKFRALADNISQLAWMADADGSVFWCNRRWQEFTGISIEQARGTGWRAAHHPDHVDRVTARFDSNTREGTPWEDTFPLRSAAGEYRWFLAHMEPVHNADSRIERWVGTATDITEQRKAEQALRESEGRERARTAELEAIMDAVPAAILTTTDPNSSIRANRAACDLFRIPYGSGTAPDSGKAFLADHLNTEAGGESAEPEASVRRTAQTREPLREIEFDFTLKDGTVRNLVGNIVPLAPTSDSGGAVGAFIDITERKKAEAALRRSNQDLEQFAYAASHDLQEPLRSISGMTELLARRYRGKFDEQADNMFRLIIDASARMGTMISDLLAYSRVSSNAAAAQHHVDVSNAVELAVRNLRTLIAESGASIKYSELPRAVADPGRLAMLFQNLLGNAIKYRRNGTPPYITITAEERGGEWLFAVRDNGVGFEPRDAERIFGVFKRLHGREIPGTGIGLALCRTIVEKNGGRIWAEGKPDAGATFFFTLPAAN